MESTLTGKYQMEFTIPGIGNQYISDHVALATNYDEKENALRAAIVNLAHSKNPAALRALELLKTSGAYDLTYIDLAISEFNMWNN